MQTMADLIDSGAEAATAAALEKTGWLLHRGAMWYDDGEGGVIRDHAIFTREDFPVDGYARQKIDTRPDEVLAAHYCVVPYTLARDVPVPA